MHYLGQSVTLVMNMKGPLLLFRAWVTILRNPMTGLDSCDSTYTSDDT